MPDLRFGDADEERGVLGLVAAGLHAVFFVVQADADDLARVRNHRKESHLRKLDIGLLRAFCDFLGLGERASGEQGAQVRKFPADAPREIDDAVAGDDSVAGALGSAVARELHFFSPPKWSGLVYRKASEAHGRSGHERPIDAQLDAVVETVNRQLHEAVELKVVREGVD